MDVNSLGAGNESVDMNDESKFQDAFASYMFSEAMGNFQDLTAYAAKRESERKEERKEEDRFSG